MKRIFFIIVSVVLCQTSGFAQRESSINFFMATPVGKFASTNVEDGGFAKPGWGIALDSKSSYNFLPENLSLYFHSSYQWNKMDTEKVAEVFSAELGNKVEVSDSKYSPILATLGPSYEIDLSSNIIFSLDATIGMIFNNTKAFTIEVYDDLDNVIATELVNFNDKISFAYTFGAELQFVLVPDVFSVALYADYTSANQQVELSFRTAAPVDSFQQLQYINSGIKLILNKM